MKGKEKADIQLREWKIAKRKERKGEKGREKSVSQTKGKGKLQTEKDK